PKINQMLYDDSGNRQAERGGARDFRYDAAGRLTRIQDHAAGTVEELAYDPFGSLIRRKITGNLAQENFIFDQNATVVVDNHAAGQVSGRVHVIAHGNRVATLL